MVSTAFQCCMASANAGSQPRKTWRHLGRKGFAVSCSSSIAKDMRVAQGIDSHCVDARHAQGRSREAWKYLYLLLTDSYEVLIKLILE